MKESSVAKFGPNDTFLGESQLTGEFAARFYQLGKNGSRQAIDDTVRNIQDDFTFFQKVANLANSSLLRHAGSRMRKIKIKEAKDNFSLILRLIREKKEDLIIIYRGAIPIAEIRPYQGEPKKSKLTGFDKKAKLSHDFHRYLPDEINEL